MTALTILFALVWAIARGSAGILVKQLYHAYNNDRFDYARTGQRGRQVVVLERALSFARWTAVLSFVAAVLLLSIILVRIAP